MTTSGSESSVQKVCSIKRNTNIACFNLCANLITANAQAGPHKLLAAYLSEQVIFLSSICLGRINCWNDHGTVTLVLFTQKKNFKMCLLKIPPC